jgi:hypothetical protein
MPHWYIFDAKYSPIKEHIKPLGKENAKALAAIHSQNTTAENHLKYY